MILKSWERMALLTAAAALMLAFLPQRAAAAQPVQDQAQPKYTMDEYKALEAARVEKDPQQGIKLLDAFVAQYPNSTLMPYVYQQYIADYNALKDYAKVMEYSDKTVALGDKVDAGTRLQALDTRVHAFYSWYSANSKDPTASDQLTKQRDAALLGAKMMESFPKPANASDEAFAETKKKETGFFEEAAAYADVQLKDQPGAIQEYKAAIATDASDTAGAARDEYQIGLAQLAENPPQTLDGFWSIARAISLKMPEADQVKEFLRARIMAYEQPGCTSQADAQLNEMLQLAANASDRPATYTIPSQDDLSKIRNASNILTIISDLSAGGDKAKMTWLAVCGSELPEVAGKIIDVQKGDNYVDFMAFTADTGEAMQAGTTANMDVKVWTANPPAAAAPAGGAATAGAAGAAPTQDVAQPDVVRLQKDDGIKFSGTLVSYDPSPFMLHWDQVKVDPSVIPAEKPAAKRPARRTTHR